MEARTFAYPASCMCEGINDGESKNWGKARRWTSGDAVSGAHQSCDILFIEEIEGVASDFGSAPQNCEKNVNEGSPILGFPARSLMKTQSLKSAGIAVHILQGFSHGSLGQKTDDGRSV